MYTDLITIDYETESIVGNPLIHPPKPVGVAIWIPGGDPTYQPINSTTVEQLHNIYASGRPTLYHNAPFDLAVGHSHLGLPLPPWELVHDTQYLVYLKDPHAPSLALKPSADRYLNLPPEEQDDLKDWILANVPEATKKNWGAYISKAPFELVSRYAKGDVYRTRLLFDYLHPIVPHEPYDRERRLSPHLVAATQKGVRTHRIALANTLTACEQAQEQCEQRIRVVLNSPTLNTHSGDELASALSSSGAIAEKDWVLTPTGKKSTARPNLMAGIKDPALLNLLVYSGAMQTAIGTFLRPWLEKSAGTGRLHPNWNQIRSTEDRIRGTRTGRLSSDDPNFQNIPNPFEFDLPEGLIDMPFLRNFILPEEGHVWLKRDWSAQEMRILAHFEDGAFLKQYQDNPALDPHDTVRQMIKTLINKDFKRKFIKETGFGQIYGMGAPGLAKKIGGGMLVSEARDLQQSYHLALPGVGILQGETKRRGKEGLPVTTWGGREYHAEAPKIVNGMYKSFEYKLTNYLIQGSAADQTKQCLIDWFEGKPTDSVFMATVHDENNISAPEEDWKPHMEWLKECMNKDYFDCPMRSDSFKGPTWGELKEVKE